MSRTYRRQHERHEYRWVLHESIFESGHFRRITLDPRSPEGRRAISRFHSDAQQTMDGSPPRWFRRLFKRRQRGANDREYRRWLTDSGYDPVIQARHRNSAKWAWW